MKRSVVCIAWDRRVLCILFCVVGCSEQQVELDCVNDIIARCEARARSLLAGTIFDDVQAPPGHQVPGHPR